MTGVGSSLLPAVPVALALAGVALGCGSDMPQVPANPTYTADVAPILNLRCIRCHGLGDMLHTMIVNGYPNNPSTCYLQRYEDEGDCADPNSTTCKRGAAYCGTRVGPESLITSMINMANDSSERMPPPPTDPLTDFEKAVINRWSTTSPVQ
jgi:hypothetical protein